ncbi:MAG: MerR family transcriptional regulator [Sedimenticola sp.]|nr:MerR family transcriptional regulator [Sedimenticola sp.]
MGQELTIGQLSQRTEVSVSTIRFYEQKGLLEGPPRNKSGYRVYPQKMVEKVLFIKSCRDLDFSLSTVADLLKLCYSDGDRIDCASIQTEIEKQHAAVTEQIELLKHQRDKLERLLSDCSMDNSRESCGFIRIMLD